MGLSDILFAALRGWECTLLFKLWICSTDKLQELRIYNTVLSRSLVCKVNLTARNPREYNSPSEYRWLFASFTNHFHAFIKSKSFKTFHYWLPCTLLANHLSMECYTSCLQIYTNTILTFVNSSNCQFPFLLVCTRDQTHPSSRRGSRILPMLPINLVFPV